MSDNLFLSTVKLGRSKKFSSPSKREITIDENGQRSILLDEGSKEFPEGLRVPLETDEQLKKKGLKFEGLAGQDAIILSENGKKFTVEFDIIGKHPDGSPKLKSTYRKYKAKDISEIPDDAIVKEKDFNTSIEKDTAQIVQDTAQAEKEKINQELKEVKAIDDKPYVWLPAKSVSDIDFEKNHPDRVKKIEDKKYYLTEIPMLVLKGVGTPDLENYNGNGWIGVKAKDGSIQAFQLNYSQGGKAFLIRQQDLPAYAKKDVKELLNEKVFTEKTQAESTNTTDSQQTTQAESTNTTDSQQTTKTQQTTEKTQTTTAEQNPPSNQRASKLPQAAYTPDQVAGGNVQGGDGYYAQPNRTYASPAYVQGFRDYNFMYDNALTYGLGRYLDRDDYIFGMLDGFMGIDNHNPYNDTHNNYYANPFSGNMKEYIEQAIKDTLKSLGLEKTQETQGQTQKTQGYTEEEWKEIANMLDDIRQVLLDDKNEKKGLEIAKIIAKFSSIVDSETGKPKYSRKFIMDMYKQAYHANDNGDLIQDIRENVPNNTGLTDADDLVRLLNAPELKFKEFLNYDNPADIVKGEKDKEANVGATTGWGLALSGLATAGTGLLRNAFGTKGKIVLALITALAGTGITTGLAGQAEKKNKQREEQGKEYKEYKEGLK